MKLTGNTVLVTGGGSGIGRGLAEALHKLGNKVIVAGRRKANLADVVKANPGIDAVELDVSNPESIASVSKELIAKYPKLNVLLNNAGIMLLDDVSKPVEDSVLTSQFETNFLGTVRLTSELIEHLKAQESATVLNVSSVLGFVPMAVAAIYSATKSRPPRVHNGASLPTQRNFGSGTGDCSALGTDGPPEQQRRGPRDASEAFHRRDDRRPGNRGQRGSCRDREAIPREPRCERERLLPTDK